MLKFVNIRGDLFAAAFCFFAQAVIKLASSLILTRILLPEAYGVITILMSIVYVIELIADINVTLFIVRDKDAEQRRYLDTAWTLRLGRSLLNSVVLFVCAPLICSSIYQLPALTAPLRVFSLWFIFNGLESMSFPLAIRRKRSRIVMYSELAASILATAATLLYCHYSRDYWGIVYGILLNRLIVVVMSYQFYRDLRPRLRWDWAAAREVLQFTKFSMPSSMITLGLSQFDKVAFLRLFDLNLLGVYGLAGNIASPIESLIARISQTVLYPRVAHNARDNRETYGLKYYTENTKLFVSILILPALVGGASHFIVAVLYPPRYAQASVVLQAFMVRAALLSFASPAEDLLIAAGETQVILLGNVLRAAWIVSASVAGYYVFGFVGFAYGVALGGLPPLIYYLWLQRQKGLLIVKYEIYKVALTVGVAALAFLTSGLLSAWWPAVRHHA